MKIILIGFMGSGKTSVGRSLAKKLNINFIEMDEEILHRSGFNNMKTLFAQKGEVFLREWEIQLAKEFSSLSNLVISTGGGVVMNSIIFEYLKKGDHNVVYLQAPYESHVRRVSKDKTPRPLFDNIENANKLYKFRLPLYENYSDLAIQTEDKSISEIVDEIIIKTYGNISKN